MKDAPYFIFFWIFGLLGGFMMGVRQVSELIVIDHNYQPYVHEQKDRPADVFDRKAIFTAYNSVEEQTDDSPCIGSAGNICEAARYQRVCATRLYKLGTVLWIEGVGPCVILDRTSKKYANRIDIFMGRDIEAAKQFGIKELKYKVIN